MVSKRGTEDGLSQTKVIGKGLMESYQLESYFQNLILKMNSNRITLHG